MAALHAARALLLAMSPFLGLACALTGKSEAMVPRYFTLEPPAQQATTAAEAGPRELPTAGVAPELRLGRVTAAGHIREPIVYRQSDRELGFYDDRLWSEKPSAYLERALGRVLFEEKGLRQLIAGSGPVLDVSLLALEEVRGKTPRARVQLKAVLYEDKSVRFEQTFVVERPIVAARRGDVESVGALADALAAALAQVAERIVAELHRPVSTHAP